MHVGQVGSGGGCHVLKVLDIANHGIVGNLERNVAILLGNVGDDIGATLLGPREQVGLGGVGNHRHGASAREGVAGRRLRSAAGRHKLVVVVLGLAVHLVAGPHADVGRVDVVDEHAVARAIGVPALELAVLHDEVLTGSGCLEDKGLVARVEGRQRVGARGVDNLGCAEAQRIAVVGRVAGRGAGIVVVAAPRHDLPGARSHTLAAAARVVGVVEVLETQHVAELVAYRAYAVENTLAGTVELARAGIAAYRLAAYGIGVVAGMRPHVIGGLAGVAAHTCKDEIHHVDIAVVVGIIVGKVYLALQLLQRLGQQGRHVL